jgi:hypothetical protein
MLFRLAALSVLYCALHLAGSAITTDPHPFLGIFSAKLGGGKGRGMRWLKHTFIINIVVIIVIINIVVIIVIVIIIIIIIIIIMIIIIILIMMMMMMMMIIIIIIYVIKGIGAYSAAANFSSKFQQQISAANSRRLLVSLSLHSKWPQVPEQNTYTFKIENFCTLQNFSTLEVEMLCSGTCNNWKCKLRDIQVSGFKFAEKIAVKFCCC